MNPSDRTFGNIVFIFQPSKERGQDSSYIVDGYLADLATALVVIQIAAQIFRCDLLHRLLNSRQCFSESEIVIFKGLFGAALSPFDGKKSVYQLLLL